MKKSIIFFVLIVITCKVSFSQSDCDICKNFKNNVVKITTTFSNGSTDNGFGTIVGENGNKLIVVTAKHVIYSLDDKGYIDVKPQHVDIRFYTDQGTDYNATLLSLPDNRFDITLIEVTKPQNFTWTKDFYSDSFQTGTQVWFIGREGKWHIPLGNSTGEINEVTIDDEISIDINSILPGTSGAPLISKDGMVGVIFEDASTGAKAYPIAKIKKVMANWNYHWQLNLNPNNSKNPQTENIDISKGTSPTSKPKRSFSKKVLFSTPTYNASYELYSDKVVLHIFAYNSFPSITFDVNQNKSVDAMLDRSYAVVGATHSNICAQFLLSEISSTTCGGAPSEATLSVANSIYTFTIPLNEIISSANADSIALKFTFWSSEGGYKFFPGGNAIYDLKNVYKISL